MASAIFTRPRAVKKNNPTGRGTPTPPTPSPSIRGEGGGGDPAKASPTKVSVANLVEASRNLSVSQRKQLLAELSLLVQGDQDSTGQHRDKDMWATAVVEALDNALAGVDGAALGVAVIRRTMGASSAWLPVEQLVKAIGAADFTVAERQAVYRMLAKLLVGRCRELSDHTGAPLGPKLVANNATHLRAIFERAFPGYLAAGLAPLVAKRLLSGWKPQNP